MARYQNSFVSSKSPEEIQQVLTKFCEMEGFKFVTYKGEQVYKKGSGIMTAPQFVKVSVNGNQIFLEAWLKSALLPGVYVGEMGLDGFAAAVPKSMLKTRVERLLASLA